MKFLIFNPFGIGDVLFTTPLIRNIKENFPQAKIFYICNKRVYPLLSRNIFLEKVYVFEKDDYRRLIKKSKTAFLKEVFSFFKRIKRENFDVIFDFSLNSQYGLFFKLCGIKKRVGFNYRNRGRFLNCKEELPLGYKDKHVADYYLQLVKFVGIKPKRVKFDLFLREEDIERANNILKKLNLHKEEILVGICPGAGDSWRESAYFKRWPKEYFSTLCNLIIEELGAKVIIFGSESETNIARYIVENTKNRVIDLCGKIDLVEFSALVKMCTLFVTNDGGPFHISYSLGVKTVVFFGPVDETVYGAYPDNRDIVILKRDLSCRPCYQKFKFPGCKYDKKCLRDITVEEVFEVVRRFLEDRKKGIE